MTITPPQRSQNGFDAVPKVGDVCKLREEERHAVESLLRGQEV